MGSEVGSDVGSDIGSEVGSDPTCTFLHSQECGNVWVGSPADVLGGMG